MNRYATLDQVLQELAPEALAESVDDTKEFIWQALGFVSERIDKITADTFAPLVETKYFNARGRHIRSASLIDVVEGQPKDSHPPLGEITAISINGATISGGNYQADPKGVTPIRRILLTSTDDWSAYTSNWRGAQAITGVWVNRKGYAGAWLNSGDTVLNNPLSASGTSITVSAADAQTGEWSLKRFQPGQLLRIGATGTDYRSLESVTIGVSNDTLTVVPNANGGTSIQQAQDTAIYIWQPEPVIQRAAIKWAQHLFSRRGITTTSSLDGLNGIRLDFPPDAPREVMNILVQGGYVDDCPPEKSSSGGNSK